MRWTGAQLQPGGGGRQSGLGVNSHYRLERSDYFGPKITYASVIRPKLEMKRLPGDHDRCFQVAVPVRQPNVQIQRKGAAPQSSQSCHINRNGSFYHLTKKTLS